MTLILRYAAKSDVGMVRTSNEDSGFAGHSLLAVADGMGGHAAGELASSTAIATLAELDSETYDSGDVLTALDDSLVTAAERIADFVALDPARSGMGTTVTAIAWRAGRIAVIHVGDSRAYLLREDELSHITKDHTYVQSLVDAGRITEDQARVHPRRSLLLRAIDGNQVPERDLSIREAQLGDRYLLCSDGLSGVLTDADIKTILAEIPDPTAAVTALVDRALDGGAPDNVTVVIADVVESTDAQSEAYSQPVVVGAAGEQRNRAQLPGLHFPDDVGVDSESTDPGGLPAQVAISKSSADPHADPDQLESAAPQDRQAPISGVETPALGAETPGPAAPPIAAAAGGVSGGRRSPTSVAQRPGFLRRNWVALTVGVIAVFMIVIGGLGFTWWLGSQWFVGANAGYVNISQGVPQTFLGVHLYRVSETTALEVSKLPYYDQQQVAKTLDAATQAEARRIVASLNEHARDCAVNPPPLGCPPIRPGA